MEQVTNPLATVSSFLICFLCLDQPDSRPGFILWFSYIFQYRRGLGEVLAMIARGIEAKFGRLVPAIVTSHDFDEKKAGLFQTMLQGEHFVEDSTCTFNTIVNMDTIKKAQSDPGSSAATLVSLPPKQFLNDFFLICRSS